MTTGGRRLGFLPRSEEGSALDYLRRLSRLRWSRRFPEHSSVELDGGQPASGAFGAGEDWVVVRDEIAIPLPGPEVAPAERRVQLASRRDPADPPFVHTLAELERSNAFRTDGRSVRVGDPPALAFSVSDFPPRIGETVREYVSRLVGLGSEQRSPREFGAVVFDGTPGERPEIVRRFPEGTRRLLDVGCGSGETSAAIRRARPGVSITGIERLRSAAAVASGRVDRLLTADAADALRDLEGEGARFDAFLFADVLEHLEDPIGALALARGLASPGATLVATVPNVAHLSLVRDLVAGRFDPLPAGLADAGHLRWFTRSSLEEALEEAGWRTQRVEALPGAPAPDAETFLRRASGFPDADAEGLAAYQWLAVAHPGPMSNVQGPTSLGQDRT